MNSLLKKVIFSVFLFIGITNVNALECVSFKDGTGTESDPYVITTPMELYSINCNLDASYILGNDIDLTYDTTNENGLFYNDGKGWIAIAATDNEIEDPQTVGFSGTLDGNNKTIIGLNQIRTLNKYVAAENYGGLFSKITGTVKNLNLKNVNIDFTYDADNVTDISGWSGFYVFVGSLSSLLQDNANIDNINVDGNILLSEIDLEPGDYVNIGGISGSTGTGTITNSKNKINITINTQNEVWVGGIVGRAWSTSLRNNYNYGNIIDNGFSTIGGIVGIFPNEANIDKCYNYGNIKGGIVGGIAAYLNESFSITNSANYGTINGTKITGGIVARASFYGVDGVCIFDNNFNVGNIHGNYILGGLIGKSDDVNINNSFNIGNIYVIEDIDMDYDDELGVGGLVGITTGSVNASYNAGRIFRPINYFSYSGEIVGRNKEISNSINGYYLIEEWPKEILISPGVGANRPIYGSKIYKDDFSISSSYSSFDFENVWTINETFPLPQLINNPIEGNYVNSIKIILEKENVRYNEKIKFDVELLPNDIDNKNVVWEVENIDGTATIDENGLLTATGIGKVLVKAYSNSIGAYMDEFELEILPLLIENIDVNGEEEVFVGNIYEYILSYTPTENINKEVIWSVENKTGTATINQQGVLTPLTNGTVIIKVQTTDGSGVFKEKEISIKTLANSIEIESESSEFYVNESYKFNAIVLPAETSNKEVVWSISDTDIATIDSISGILTTKKVGTVSIYAHSKDGSNITEAITIDIKSNIEKLNFKINESCVYNGKAKRPKVIITDGEYTLQEWQDYTLEYANNINAGKGIVYVNGKNYYAGTVEIEFEIAKANFGHPTEDTVYTYDGDYKTIRFAFSPEDSSVVQMKIANENGEYVLNDMPMYKDAGTYIIKYRLSDRNNNYNVYYGSNTLTIKKLEIPNFTQYDYETYYDGSEYSIQMPSIDSTYSIKYLDNSGKYTLTSSPKYKDIGEYTIKYKVSKDNYNDLYKQGILRIYGIRSFDKSLYLKNGYLVINNYDNNWLSFQKRIDIYAKSLVWEHYNSQGILSNNDSIKTGDIIRINNSNIYTERYQIVMLGDVNCDAKISALDYVRIKNHIMNTKNIYETFEQTAADLNNDGRISALDYVRVKNYIMNGGN